MIEEKKPTRKTTAIDLTELAEGLLKLTDAKNKNIDATIPDAVVKPIGNGGGFISVPGKYVGQKAKVDIFKKEEEVKSE
jgi:putative transposon-encoded protein